MLFYHSLSFLLPIIVGLAFGLLFWQARLAFSVIMVESLAVFFGTWLLVVKRVKLRPEAIFYALFSLLVSLSGFALFIFIENLWLKIGLALLAVLLLYYYLHQLFIQYFKESLPKLERLWLFFRLAQVWLIFLIAGSLFGLRDFLSTPLAVLTIIFFLVVIIINGYNNWQNWDVRIKKIYCRSLFALMMAQLFWAVALLPLVYYLNGMIVAIFYAIINELITWHFERKIPVKSMKIFLVFAFILLILIMATAQWS